MGRMVRRIAVQGVRRTNQGRGVEDDRRLSEEAMQTVVPFPGSVSNAMRYVPDLAIT